MVLRVAGAGLITEKNFLGVDIRLLTFKFTGAILRLHGKGGRSYQ